MRNSKQSGSFFPCLFVNMLMNIEGLLPAVILSVLHFWLKISVWWSVHLSRGFYIRLCGWYLSAGQVNAARRAICRKKTKIRIP